MPLDLTQQMIEAAPYYTAWAVGRLAPQFDLLTAAETVAWINATAELQRAVDAEPALGIHVAYARFCAGWSGPPGRWPAKIEGPVEPSFAPILSVARKKALERREKIETTRLPSGPGPILRQRIPAIGDAIICTWKEDNRVVLSGTIAGFSPNGSVVLALLKQDGTHYDIATRAYDPDDEDDDDRPMGYHRRKSPEERYREEERAIEAVSTGSTARVQEASIGPSGVDASRGPVARVQLEHGELRVGDFVVAGVAFGKIRAMYDAHDQITMAVSKPLATVALVGLDHLPDAGDTLHVVKDPKKARGIADARRLRRDEDHTWDGFTTAPHGTEEAAGCWSFYEPRYASPR